MARNLTFTSEGWDDYLYWQSNDKQVLKKINKLVKECVRTPYEGTGKPEPLKWDLSKAWSRRITDEHRLVYIVTEKEIRVFSCRYHY